MISSNVRAFSRRSRSGVYLSLASIFLLAVVTAAIASVRTMQDSEGVARQEVFSVGLPNLPGQRVTGVLVTYAPGGRSAPHHHTLRGSVVGYGVEGTVRSQVNDGPASVYAAGQTWFEPPGAAHRIAKNASDKRPARVLAIFVADSGAILSTRDTLVRP